MQQEGGNKEDGQRDNEVDGVRLRDDDDDDDDYDEEEEKQGRSGSKKDEEEEEGEEDEESTLDLRNHLRDDILETVDECLTAHKKGRIQDAGAPRDPLYRCAVCTLPHGACRHTPQWLEAQERFAILDPLPKDNVDLSMDDISDILEPAPAVHRGGIACERGAPSLSNLRWENMRAQPADELSGEKVDLSSPPSRAGHTMVLFNGAGSLREDGRLLVVFGGVSVANNSEHALVHVQPGARTNHGGSHGSDKYIIGEGGVSEQALSYHADIRVFRVGFSTWHCPDATGDLPEGRYGHVSLALDDTLMWVFGGRLKGGHQASDTYVLNVQEMRWDRTNTAAHGEPNPAPRAWSAAAKVRQRIFLFGGTDLRSGRMFDDIWAWDVQTRSWGEHIVVGTPPLARYGHVLLACPDEQILVLGGCCVSSLAETGLPADNDQLNLRVRVAADRVNHAYQLEEEETAVVAPDNFDIQGGIARRNRKDYVGRCPDSRGSYPAPASWKELSRREAQLAAAVAAREKDTAIREEKLRAVLDERVAMTHWAKLRSLHPLKELDAIFLDTKSMIWGVVDPPPIGGGKTAPPAARMHFSAVVLGQKVVLWGGCLPTSKRMETVDGGVHVFDLVRRRWSAPVGHRHPDGIQPRVDAAVVQLRRAERALFEATQRAMTMGAPGGRTMQVVQAEAVIAVNRWRVRRLEHEIQCAEPSPRPRAAHAGCALGHRVMYFGGWGAEDAKGEFLVLDIEEPAEKERRLEDEFHLRLDRERQQRETAEAEALRRAAMEENMRKGLELARETAETVAMSAEDARSAIPELTIAPVPRLLCANASTLWLGWDRPKVDAIGNPPGGRVEYTLYMSGGFREWAVGDHVLVEYMSKAQRKAAASSSVTTLSVTDCDSMTRGLSPMGGSLGQFASVGSTSADGGQNNGGGSSSNSEGNRKTPINVTQHSNSNEIRKEGGGSVPPDSVGHSEPRLLPANIIAPSNGAGLFDIRWGDGERERGVRRHRIHRAATPSPIWTAIYQGEDCHYAVQGMVPESILQRERDFRYEVSARFSLQTKGTEVPRDKQSRHSPVVTMRTHFEGQGPLGEGRWLGKGGSSGSIKARLATAKALDSSISASGGPTHSSLPRAGPAHGQYVTTGRGKLYL